MSGIEKGKENYDAWEKLCMHSAESKWWQEEKFTVL
jgi:hypothetical protein